jgi:hypothetical protein
MLNNSQAVGQDLRLLRSLIQLTRKRLHAQEGRTEDVSFLKSLSVEREHV